MPIFIGQVGVDHQRALPYTIFITSLPLAPPQSADAVDSSTQRKMVPGVIAGLLFVLLGILLIPLAGIQNDEAIFAMPLYERSQASFWNRISHLDLPAMTMTYLGALKGLLYLPLLETLGANVWTVRLPVVLLCGITIFLFYRLAEIVQSRRAAVTAAFLLATDPLFLMTGTFDWGPVVIEHFLLVTGCYALCRFGRSSHSSGRKWHKSAWLAAGFLCFGLALWNKAVFSWALIGLTVAAIATLWPYLWRFLSVRNAAIAGAAFVIGAFPLIWYNVKNNGVTFRQNTHLALAGIPEKWIQVELALQGKSVFGYIAAEEWLEPKKDPGTVVARSSAWLRERLGQRHTSGFYYVVGAALLLIPLWWQTRAAWFSVVFCTVAWLLMAMTEGAGTGAHHVVLLWPFPILFVASVLDGLPRMIPSWIFTTIVTVLVAMNLTVVNQYLYQLQHYGGAQYFTDAIFPLSDVLKQKGGTIYAADWGMSQTLVLLHRGRLNVRWAADPLVPDTPSPDQVKELHQMLRDPTGLFIGYPRGQEIFPNVGLHLDALAKQAGMRMEVVQVISDSNGRPIFEISRAVPVN